MRTLRLGMALPTLKSCLALLTKRLDAFVVVFAQAGSPLIFPFEAKTLGKCRLHAVAERLAQQRKGSCRAGGEAVGEFVGSASELIVVYDLVDHSPFVSCRGGNALSKHEHLDGTRLANQARQQPCSPRVRYQPHLGERHQEEGRSSGDHKIGRERQGASRAGSRAVDRRYDWYRQIRKKFDHWVDMVFENAARIEGSAAGICARTFGNVRARAE